jgi:hypothetical protein
MKNKKVILPENYDPYSKSLKKLFHEKADNLNFIGQPSGYPQLLCGAVRKGKRCHVAAGRGTSHSGYGRCRYHGGASTGPKTPEGKARSSRNGEKHGFFSKVLTESEYKFFVNFMASEITLEPEIAYWRLKILAYLEKNTQKWQQAYEEKKDDGDINAEEYADRQIRKTTYSRSYHIGTAEDPVLMHALDILGRLIETQAKLKPRNSTPVESLIKQVNQELQAASYGQVSIGLNRK